MSAAAEKQQLSVVTVKPAVARDVTLLVLKEHYEQARQHETQRQLVTAALLIIAAWFVSEIVRDGFRLSTLPMSVTLILLGGLGALFGHRIDEQHARHAAIAARLRHRIEPQLTKVLRAARQVHDREWSNRRLRGLLSGMRLDATWMVVPVTVSLIGVGCALMSVMRARGMFPAIGCWIRGASC